MFSWIIEYKSKIIDIKNWLFTVEKPFKESLNIWESIAHDWACMTIDSFTDNTYSFFTMEESFKKTNYSEKQIWDYFNVERSLTLWDRIHGHFVSWHIDCKAEVQNVSKRIDNSIIINIQFDKSFRKNIINKWSITVNWVSLTIVEVWDDYFSISLIPLTQKTTNLWDLKVWKQVNLEFDMLGKYILNK